ncbi:hypothetical protein TTHERM_000554619 (macronuclear) [Tetrahymena thermophila SB210]|uniref:Uncharacterized protein n=1 Tax=Tetrahymena thermophila (strain SB210) TaxID=312017 RepID=W7XJZ8_TETTS|nr:hypothetical protein TTHERM_000554619 [Tetrahymena thermophila SB210]EWS76091.1 hypothetical protein TTHERM_000554619 [Tetrahymena thermophila SB210]|eukprot:XP_012651398.1 hypothetical protein TTHERM_000554619 [Tetrahymena thermophila SB210]
MILDSFTAIFKQFQINNFKFFILLYLENKLNFEQKIKQIKKNDNGKNLRFCYSTLKQIVEQIINNKERKKQFNCFVCHVNLTEWQKILG